MTAFMQAYCISAYIIHKNGLDTRYLLLKRSGQYLPDTWQMVTGKVNPHEVTWEAAIREIQEETGIIASNLYTADAVETFYVPHLDRVIFAPVFLTFVEDIPPITLSPTEHSEYKWLSFDEAQKRLIWGEQRRIISHIQEYFIEKTPSDLYLIYSEEKVCH